MTLVPINPKSLGAPSGYSNGMLALPGGKVVSDAFPEQFAQALRNVAAIVEEAGGKPTDIAQLTIFVTDHKEYVATLKEVGGFYREIMGRHYPAMALVEVKALLEEGAKVEIQGLAVLPGGDLPERGKKHR